MHFDLLGDVHRKRFVSVKSCCSRSSIGDYSLGYAASVLGNFTVAPVPEKIQKTPSRHQEGRPKREEHQSGDRFGGARARRRILGTHRQACRAWNSADRVR